MKMKHFVILTAGGEDIVTVSTREDEIEFHIKDGMWKYFQYSAPLKILFETHDLDEATEHENALNLISDIYCR